MVKLSTWSFGLPDLCVTDWVFGCKYWFWTDHWKITLFRNPHRIWLQISRQNATAAIYQNTNLVNQPKFHPTIPQLNPDECAIESWSLTIHWSDSKFGSFPRNSRTFPSEFSPIKSSLRCQLRTLLNARANQWSFQLWATSYTIWIFSSKHLVYPCASSSDYIHS